MLNKQDPQSKDHIAGGRHPNRSNNKQRGASTAQEKLQCYERSDKRASLTAGQSSRPRQIF